MKKGITYIVLSILCLFAGFAGMYAIVYFFPSTVIDTISKVEKNVTVTDNGIADGIENVIEAVVVVENYQKKQLTGSGSGFIYDEKGYVMTNHHVIEGAEEVKLILNSGDVIDAEVVGSDAYADIAVLKIDTKYITKIAKIGSNENTRVGDTVFAIGAPMSSDYAGTVTRGILSGKDRMVEVNVSSKSSYDWIMNVMQTDAAINPGNSGGPLCTVNGEIIGINSMKIVESSVEGIGFAIPIEDALEYASSIVKGEKIKRAYLGINMADLSTSFYALYREGIEIDESITSGVVVIEADKQEPCGKAGIEKGDVITKIGDYPVTNAAELKYYLFKYKPGDKIKVEVFRGKTLKKFDVTLGTAQ